MKWFTICYLFLSIALLFFILFIIIANMVNYGLEETSFYLEMFLKYMKLFLSYIILNIIYLLAVIISYYKKEYC